MISGTNFQPRCFLLMLIAALIIARVCMTPISGYVTSRRHPRWPIIGLNSCKFAAAAIKSSTEIPNALATSNDSASAFGKNSCRGGSSKRIVTLLPPIASKIPSKSPCCIGSNCFNAIWRCSTFCATTNSRIALIRSGELKNICSVRTRPTPSAPKLTALAASSGVSAFVRIFIVLRSSAHCMNFLKLPEIVAGTVLISPR